MAMGEPKRSVRKDKNEAKVLAMKKEALKSSDALKGYGQRPGTGLKKRA